MKNVIKNLVPYLLIIIAVVFIKAFVVTPVRVIGPSMLPTLEDGDIMILNKLSRNKIKRFDIVVIKYFDERIIKRVIGLPGDTIEYKDGELYINGDVYEEPFLPEDVYTQDFILEERIPEGYYFVLGDNRAESKDSRIIGLIKNEKIKGKANTVLYPFDRIGTK